MFGFLKKVDGHIQAVGNRWQAYLAYAAFWTVAVSVVTFALHWARPFFPTGWGWAEATVLAIAALCVLAVVVSIALIAWRYFNPLISKQQGASTPPEPERPKSYLNTDVDLEDMLRAEIKGVDGRFFNNLQDVNNSLTALIQSFAADLNGKIAANDAARDVRFKNLEDAYLGEIASIRETTASFAGTLKEIDLDLKNLLYFNVRQAAVLFLDELISEAPQTSIPLDGELSRDAMEERFVVTQRFIRQVSARVAHTERGVRYSLALNVAEAEADLKANEESGVALPAGVTLLDKRRYLIANNQSRYLKANLISDRHGVLQAMRNQREDLIQRAQIRNPNS